MTRRPKLLLLHGWTLDHRSMLKQARALEDYFKVINLDRPGYGSNDCKPDLPNEHSYWFDYIDRELNAEPVHLLGISQGARVALRMAATQPSKIASLALHGAAVDGVKAPTQQQAIPLNNFIDLAKAGQLERLKQEWLSHPMMREGLTGAQLSEVSKIVADYAAADLKTPAGHNFEFSSDLITSLKKYEGPALITTGSLEASERQFHALWLRENLRNASFHSLDDAGHLANFSHPDTYNAILTKFYTNTGIITPHPDR